MGTTTHRKPWSELTVLVLAAIALLIAAAVAGAFDSPEAWTLLAVLAGAYALSRGVSRNDLDVPEPPRRIRATVASGPRTEPATPEVVVSEERLEVDKQRRPTERVRLRKEIVTEEMTITVPVRREVVRVERVPIEPDEELAEGPLTELSEGQTRELILMEERAVVDKRIVPRERVWLEKDVETTEEHFTETVRHEEVDVDREPPAGSNDEIQEDTR